MLAPGSKGWIRKYFDLVEKNEIKLVYSQLAEIDSQEFIHAALGRTGIVFGYPSRRIFGKTLDDSKWTVEEKLTLLLFEAHLFVYKESLEETQFDQQSFITDLVNFYGHHNSRSITKLFSFFVKETEEERLESILAKRVDIRMNFLDNKIWVNSANNVFVYLDVILFNEYLKHRKKSTFYNYDDFAMTSLYSISMAIHSDGVVDRKEKEMFNIFLASAGLSELHRDIITDRFEDKLQLEDINYKDKDIYLFKKFLLDISSFVIFSNHEALPEEREFLSELCAYLGLEDEDLNETLALSEQFIINNQNQISFLQNNKSIEKVYGNLSKRWIKILGRNKDKLVKELNESKELLQLIRKSTTQELTKEEKDAVKTQFLDIVRTMPSLAIFMLPGGTFLLPIILKVIPELVPSAFRDNEVDKK